MRFELIYYRYVGGKRTLTVASQGHPRSAISPRSNSHRFLLLGSLLTVFHHCSPGDLHPPRLLHLPVPENHLTD